jgi:hypothetical protein
LFTVEEARDDVFPLSLDDRSRIGDFGLYEPPKPFTRAARGPSLREARIRLETMNPSASPLSSVEALLRRLEALSFSIRANRPQIVILAHELLIEHDANRVCVQVLRHFCNQIVHFQKGVQGDEKSVHASSGTK